MTLDRLDHVTVRCTDLAHSRAFYSDVLGMVDGDRPDFGFPGAWLYLADRPVVHLIGGPGAKQAAGTGHVDHIAFAARGLSETKARLESRNITFEERGVPGRALRQLFLHDPDGVAIELNFVER
ncbi:MAG: VOC family protein [Alphaproteobacteria bacterium]|nr:VOC family protein [Alphaproteobacteria bacterium]